jgi:hypothetical protein
MREPAKFERVPIVFKAVTLSVSEGSALERMRFFDSVRKPIGLVSE